MFATANDLQQLLTLGAPGLLVVIGILTGVVIFLYRKTEVLQSKIDTIQEQRIVDAREVGRSITAPLEKIAEQNKSIYDVVLNGKRS